MHNITSSCAVSIEFVGFKITGKAVGHDIQYMSKCLYIDGLNRLVSGLNEIMTI